MHPSFGWHTYQYAEERGRAPARKAEFERLMQVPDCPRASAYDPVWVWLNHMGPVSLWLLEGLLETLELRPGQRVLDMGCGTALTSIFLAREFDVEVYAADLWIPPTQNLRRIAEADLEDRVLPLRVDAEHWPFADDFFDAFVSIDAYHYFGRGDFLARAAASVRRGGPLGFVVPGDEGASPMHESFERVGWWREHWERSELVDVETADRLPGSRALWERFLEAGVAWDGKGTVHDQPDAELVFGPSSETFGFVRMVATRR